jgi:hypothetical protein
MIVSKKFKEQIDKLPQLDRIEFRQRYDAVEEWNMGVSWLWNFTLFIFIAMACTTLIIVSIANASNNFSIIKDFLIAVKPIFIFTGFDFGLCFILYALQENIRSKMHRRLWDEYFETKVKKKDNPVLRTTFNTTQQIKVKRRR